MKAGKPSDDDDLDDLLHANSGDASNGERVPLAEGKQKQQQQSSKAFQPFGGICGLISAHLSYLCFAYPSACGCFACVLCLVVVTFLITNMVNPTQKFGVVKHDWATVNSAYDLDIAKVDHWCLGGGNEGCRCEDPLVPASRVELRSWTEAFKDNKQQIEKVMDDPLIMAELDVAIIGESAIEEMDGRWMGRRPNDQLKSIGSIFKSHFHKDKGATVEGVALGIAGDSANNVLWRLLHGEMPDGFEPKIWWVQVGMNDLTRQQCSEEVVVLGVLRIVEEILNKRPKARVVINSLLPMADLRGGTVVTEQDYKDAFSTYRGRRKSGTATAHYVRKKIDGREQIVPTSTKPKKDGDDRHHHRQLLEEALESYSARNNDNSDYIDFLQSKLHNSTRDNEDDILVENEYHTSSSMHRKLEDAEVPKNAKRDKYNPTIDREKHNQKKYQFFRKRRMPLWTSIYSINKQLFKFCEKHEKVDFFDATNVFAERKSDGSQRFFTLVSDRISARGHPTELGYSKWEDAMVKKITIILGEMKESNPELFMSAPDPVENPLETVGGRTGESRGNPAEVDRLEKKPLIDENRGEDMTATKPEKTSEDSGEGDGDKDSDEGDKDADGEEAETNDEEEEGEDDGDEDQTGNVQTSPKGRIPPQSQQQYTGRQPGLPQKQQQQQYSGVPQQQMQGNYPMQGAGGVQGGIAQPQNQQLSGGTLQQQQQYSTRQPGMPQYPQTQQFGTPANGVAQGGLTQPQMSSGNFQQPQQIGGLSQGAATQQPGIPVKRKKVKKKKTAPPVETAEVEEEDGEVPDEAEQIGGLPQGAATRQPGIPVKPKKVKKKKTAPPVETAEVEEEDDEETDEAAEGEEEGGEETGQDKTTEEDEGDDDSAADGDEANEDGEETDEAEAEEGDEADADETAAGDEADADETEAGDEETDEGEDEADEEADADEAATDEADKEAGDEETQREEESEAGEDETADDEEDEGDDDAAR